MIRSQYKRSAETCALLEREHSIPAQPAAVRARMLARARVALLAGAASGTATEENAPRTESPARRTWWAAAAVVACLAGAAAGAVAYEAARSRPEPSLTPRGRLIEVVPRAAAPAQVPAAPATIPDPTATAAPAIARSSTRSHAATADSVREELRLLHRSRAAVGRADYAAALLPIGEHTRRFPDGRLAEEREALRVKSLAGLGRTEQARRAALRFEARFPRSVLSPAVSRMPVTPP